MTLRFSIRAREKTQGYFWSGPVPLKESYFLQVFVQPFRSVQGKIFGLFVSTKKMPHDIRAQDRLAIRKTMVEMTCMALLYCRLFSSTR